MRFTKVKYCILHLGHNNPMKHHRPGKDWLKICPVEKDLGILINSWLNMSQRVSRWPRSPKVSWQNKSGQQDKGCNSVVVALALGTGEATTRILCPLQVPSVQEGH